MTVNANKTLQTSHAASPLGRCVMLFQSELSPSSHLLLFSQSFLTVLIDDRHLGHLCMVDLNVSRQKGIRQQPATQL